MYDNSAKSALMFKKCIKRLGKLKHGECYGLVLALALGGSADLDSVRRVKALEHFTFLAQLGQVDLVDFNWLDDTCSLASQC
jgi:hypothetical protein